MTLSTEHAPALAQSKTCLLVAVLLQNFNYSICYRSETKQSEAAQPSATILQLAAWRSSDHFTKC